MLRRTVLQWLAAIPAVRVWAQTASFPGAEHATLRSLAAAVLPSKVSDQAAARFERWVRDYRPGAEMEHGYGFTRLRAKPASPAPVYLAQLQALHGPLADPDPAARRRAIEAALDQAGIKELPRTPDGKHIISDLMSFYFRGPDANDLCYRAQIRREACRGLEGSDNAPPPLEGTN